MELGDEIAEIQSSKKGIKNQAMHKREKVQSKNQETDEAKETNDENEGSEVK